MWWSNYFWIDTNSKQSKLSRILLRFAYFIDGVDLVQWRKVNKQPKDLSWF